MSYVDNNLRFVLDDASAKPLRRRSEGRLKTYDSSEDLRSWNYTVDDRRRQILDVVKSDIEKCGNLSTAILHALCQRSKAELARNLKILWDFLKSRNLSPEENEQLKQLKIQMGYVCLQAIKDCTCIGDYELVCVCDDESGLKHEKLFLGVAETLEKKLRNNEPLYQEVSKEKGPCVCLTNDQDTDPSSTSVQLRSANLQETNIDATTSAYGPGLKDGSTGVSSGKLPCPPTCPGFKRIKGKEVTSEVTVSPRSLASDRPTVSDDTMRQGPSGNEISGPNCHPSCIRYKSTVTRPDTITPAAPVKSSKGSPNCHPSCIRYKSMESGESKQQSGRGKSLCKCAEKATSTYPPPQKNMRSVKLGVLTPGLDQSSEAYKNMQNKLKALECLCKEQQDNIKNIKKEKDEMEKKYQLSARAMGLPTDCSRDMLEFERELGAIQRSPEMEASIIKRELDILKQYCLKLKAAEEENEKLRKEQNELKQLGRPRIVQGTVATGTEANDEDCESCVMLKGKIQELEQRLEECTKSLPEDMEIYKNRSALIDSTLAERDEMQKKMSQINEMQAQLSEYKKRAARAEELEGQLRMLQKEKSSSYELKRIQSKCSCVQREVENLRAERDAIQRRLDLTKDEMEHLRAKAKEAEVLMVERDKLQIKLNDLAHVEVHNENLRLKCKCLESAANERDMYKQKYEQQLERESETESLKAQLEASTSIKRERDSLKKQVVDLQSCIVDQENEIKRLMEEIDSLVKNKDDIQSRMKEALASMKSEIEKKDQLIASADGKLNKMQSELRNSIQGATYETDGYKARIEELENELNEAKGQIALLEDISKQKHDNAKKAKACEYEAICSMKKELMAANSENKKLQEIANNMAVLTGDEHVQRMLRQSECAVRKVVEELSKQYREWDSLKKDRRRSKSGSPSPISNIKDNDLASYKSNKCPGELIALKLENAKKRKD